VVAQYVVSFGNAPLRQIGGSLIFKRAKDKLALLKLFTQYNWDEGWKNIKEAKEGQGNQPEDCGAGVPASRDGRSAR
jgi:hypothetical protein